MRFIQKRKVLQAVKTMIEAHGFIEEKCVKKEINLVSDMLVQLQEMAMKVGNLVESDTNYSKDLIAELENYCEQLYEYSLIFTNFKFALSYNEEMKKQLKIIEELVQKIDAKIKIVFFPYKYSMWDSLESIWEAANKDVGCECQVVPVPYYTKDEKGEFSQIHYEGADYAGICSIMDYEDYYLEKEQPDIMYIHNPYDQYNTVTRIDNRFFSEELKKNGGLLVYVPYYLSGECEEYESLNIAYCKGIINSDYVVLQSEELKKAYRYWGFPERRLLVLGSPKIDAVRKLSEREVDLSEKWSKVIEGKKVILLNTTIGSVFNNEDWLLKLKDSIKIIINNHNLALIWRPHPLLYDTIKDTNDKKKQYDELVRIITDAENAVMDDSKDAMIAIKFSDAMISDYSSLVLQYTFTGKPTLLWVGSTKKRSKNIFCDYYGNYFLEDGILLEQFLEMVQRKEDPKRRERILAVMSGMENTNGTCGKKVHNVICRELENW